MKSVWKKDNRKPKPVLTDREHEALNALAGTVEMLLSLDAAEIDALKAYIYHPFTVNVGNSPEIHFGVQVCLEAMDSVEEERVDDEWFKPLPCEEHGALYCDCDK